jgi:hypothetical protein
MAASPTMPHFVRHLPAARACLFCLPAGLRPKTRPAAAGVRSEAQHGAAAPRAACRSVAGASESQRRNMTCRKRHL